MDKKKFKAVPKKYRPIPFWSWNEKLYTEETKRQIDIMNKVGMGGFFMHARGGLQSEYMGEEWFENVEASIDQAKKYGMRPWAYDENGWPSGFGNGNINAMGSEYQQKLLRMEKTPEHKETQICKSGEHYFYYELNPFYVDNLDKKVVKAFIDLVYEPYYKRFGNKIEGFFTDEPQLSRRGIPWSFVFYDEYKSRYNEDLYEHLEELFFEKGDYKKTRVKFWKMVTELFCEAYAKQIYDWCGERGLKLTGHLIGEEIIQEVQITANGACMPHYEYFHIPGMDWLGREVYDVLTVHQVASVAAQLGKEAVLSETFAMCGHNVSLAELKGIYEWQMVRGVNLLCQHLQGYSIRGIRKRDYPPAVYFQQPWWNEYDKLIDAVSREGMLLCEGKEKVDVLVIHPQTTAWSLVDCGENKGVSELNDSFLKLLRALEEKHIPFHLGDEIIMERHAKVQNGKIVIGNQSYGKVITSCCDVLLPKTKELLCEYEACGGKTVTVSELQDNNIVSDKSITYAVRYFDDFTLHYFVNSSKERKEAKINVNGKRLDAYSGNLLDFDGQHSFEPWGSLMIIEDSSKNIEHEEKNETYIYPEGKFRVMGKVENVLTLDRCDYWFDGKLQERNGYVLNIAQRANARERATKIYQEYHVIVNEVPNEIYLVCETPDMFKIIVNGEKIDKTCKEYYRDKSLNKIDIQKYLIKGENTISFDCEFNQSPQVWANIKNAAIFPTEKNKLAYDMEIEPIYLVGNFGVETKGTWTELDKDAVRYKGTFEIGVPVTAVDLKQIQKQGFPFFCGEMTLEGEINVHGENPVLILKTSGVSALRVNIGDIKATLISDDRLSLGKLVGKQKISLTLINTLRNLMGPHHLKEGESLRVKPLAFFKEKCVWNEDPEKDWDDDYCFVNFSVKNGEHEFKGKWITAEEFYELEPKNVFHRQLEKTQIKSEAPQNSHILFRKKFNSKSGKRTYIYLSADDYYKLYVNGSFVCQGPAAGYNFHYYYNKVDITDFIKDGVNTVAVHTYYQGLINRVWVSGDDRHGLILDVEQEGRVIVSSDESFLYDYHSGFSQIGKFGYETQFAQKYKSGNKHERFFEADYNDSDWKNAKLKKYVDYVLFEQPSKMLVFEEIVPELVWDENGVTADFGAMYVGYLLADAKGKNGDVIELLFSQELNEDGSVRHNIRANCDYREEWQLSGENDTLNEFDYKAYRYARLNIPEGCKVENIRFIARHYPFELKAEPDVCDEKLLQVWELCIRSLKYGSQEVIQDCMEREKGNYLGDGCYTALAHAIITKDTALFKKLFDDSLRSSFINKGLMTCAACSFMQEIAEFPLMMYYAMYSYYRLTGDKEYLVMHYNQLCEILDFYKDEYMNEDCLLSNLDKWCVVEWPNEYRDGYDADLTEGQITTDVHNVINAHYIGAIKYLNKISDILGYDRYCDEKPFLDAFTKAFYNEDKKLFKDNVRSEHISLMSNVFPLMYDLCPDKECEERIVELIKEKGFTSVMLFGAFPVLAGLKRIGKTELMYEFIKDENAWLRMIREGATVTFEGWGKDAKWNTSLFHLTLSYAVVFLTDWEVF